MWSRNVTELALELKTLRFQIADQQKLVDAQPKTWTLDDKRHGRDLEAKRQFRFLERMKTEERLYSAYVAPIQRLLALDPADFDPGKFNIEELVPRRSLGEPNSIYDLAELRRRPIPTGLVAGDDGVLDLERSFRHVDYFSALSAIRVRNNVQKDVGPQPVDFIAVPLKDSIWLRRTADRQALIETRVNPSGIRELHYLPVANLTQDQSGEPHYDRAAWSSGFPSRNFRRPAVEPRRRPHPVAERLAHRNRVVECDPSHPLFKRRDRHRRSPADAPRPGRVSRAQTRAAQLGHDRIRQRPLEFQRAQLQSRRQSRIFPASLHSFSTLCSPAATTPASRNPCESPNPTTA